jgi:PhnB protein
MTPPLHSSSEPSPSIPEGYTTVAPWLVTADTRRLMRFLDEAFGAEELALLATPDGTVAHAEMRIGDVVVLLFDTPPGWPATPSHLRIYVADADAAVERAVVAGAGLVTPVSELFWGDRVGRVRDPLDNIWWVQEGGAPLDPEEVARRATEPDFEAAMTLMGTSLTEARA